MKNTKNTFQKLISIVLILSFLTPLITPKKTYAIFGIADTGDAILGAMLGVDIAKKITDGGFQVKDAITGAYNLYQNALSAKNIVQGIKNFDAETFAKNASSDVLNEVGNSVMNQLGITKDQATNVYTQGKQIVTNFGNYLDMLSINEIKKGLANLQITVNTTPYNADIYKSVVDFARQTSDTALGKVVNFSLPYIAKEEICSSPKLKDIIKNGEPETFIRPKKAVGNIDIDKLCNTSLQKPRKEAAEAQAAFVGLAKAGYGGPRTNEAVADSKNTPSGVAALAIENIMSQRGQSVDTAARQIEATGMFIGDQKCVDKNGKEIKFDPTDSTQYCDQQFSTAQGSGSVLQEKVAAAAAAPYQSLMARMDAIHNKLKSGNLVSSDVWSITSSIINMGKKDMTNIISSDDDHYYKGLANSLSSLQRTQGIQNDLWDATELASREYAYGSERYTSDDLQRTLDIYTNIRILNTQKLNVQNYTYLLLKNSVANADIAVADAKATSKSINSAWFGMGSWFKKGKTAKKAANNKAEAAKKLTLALINLTSSNRNLIKEMAKNNYREQQIRKLLLELRDTKDVDTENQQEALAQALDGAYTEKDYEYLLNDWNYVPEYSEINTDPYTATEKDASYYIPTRDEIEGPYTENLLRYLRVRSYLLLKDSIDSLNSIKNLFDLVSRSKNPTLNIQLSSSDMETFAAYGIKDLDRLTPNLPRPSKTTTAIIDAAESKNYSELSYCEQTKLGICKNDELKLLAGTLQEDFGLGDGGDAEEEQLLRESCIDPAGSVRKLCAQDMYDDPDFVNACRDEAAIQRSIEIATKECAY